MMLASANHQIQTVSITEHRHVCSLLFFSQVLSIIKGRKGKKKGVNFFYTHLLEESLPGDACLRNRSTLGKCAVRVEHPKR